MISHLLHIGYPKTGSKFLQRWFDAHPRIAFAQWGIAGARDTMRLTETLAFREDLDCAVTSFEGFVTPLPDYRNIDHGSDARLIPRRSELTRLAEALASLFPSARVLIVTRGLREIMRSYHGEAVRDGFLGSLDEFCRRFFMARDAEDVPLDYDFTIGLHERLFGPGRVTVLPYELLEREPERFVRAIEDAFGIAHCPLPLERVHASLSPAELRLYRRVGQLLTGLPLGAAGRKRLLRLHLKLVRGNRLAGFARLAERGGRDEAEDHLPEAVVEALRGSASCLRGRAFYAGLEAEYLL